MIDLDRDGVLFVSHMYPNAARPISGTFVQGLATALADDLRVQVLAPLPEVPIRHRFTGVAAVERDPDVGTIFHPRYFTMPGFAAGLRWRSYARATSRWAQEGLVGAPMIHAHWLYPDVTAVAGWAETRGLPIVATVHGASALGVNGGRAGPSRSARALARCAMVIAVSDGLADGAMKLGVPSERIAVVGNGVDLSRFVPVEPAAARDLLDLRSDRRIVLAVSRLAPEKRIDRLLDALSHRSLADADLHVLGEGPERSALAAKSAALGLVDRVFLHGAVPHEQLNPWYRAADVLALSSEREGHPVVIREALACGLPVAAMGVGAVPQMLADGTHGIVVPPRGTEQTIVEALAIAMVDALDHSWDRAAIAEHGRKFTWAAVAKDTIRVYVRAMSAGPASNS